MKHILTSILVLLFCIAGNAQDALQLITENPNRAANNMHSYEFCEIYDTPAPKGYKPYYIEHYGRHGSRYEQNHTFADAALKGFHALDSLNLLTEEGKALYADVKAIVDAHVGMEGSLTPRGGNEHKMIAARMADRYPSIFTDKNRQEISCFSSTNFRCIVSMANFAESLKGKYPSQQISFTSAERYMAYINPSLWVRRPGAPAPAMPSGSHSRRPSAPGAPKEIKAPGIDLTRFYTPLFTDINAAVAVIGDQEAFVKGIYSAGGLCQVIDFMGIDIFKHFTPEELVYFWKSGNNSIYRMWGGSKEMGDNIRYAIRPLLRDFVEKADAALAEGSHRAADFRFGHDTSILPLFALLGVDDLKSRTFPYAEAADHDWFAFFQVPMATNIQMVFYKNKKGSVLTKVLYNEKEVKLPGIEPVSGPYYDWPTLREHFLKLCAD